MTPAEKAAAEKANSRVNEAASLLTPNKYTRRNDPRPATWLIADGDWREASRMLDEAINKLHEARRELSILAENQPRES